MTIISVVGARPNFMKIAPFIKAIEAYNTSLQTTASTGGNLSPSRGPSEAEGVNSELETLNSELISHLLVHTGQHYDDRMSKAFFKSLGIPDADVNLGIGSGTHAEQVGNTMIAIEKVLIDEKPDWVVVVGDVNATLACSVAAKKLHIKVCHIEAGLRSGDERMPEEINRLVTDRLSDLLLTPDTLSNGNLKAEGVPNSKIKFVGNIMIDTLEANRELAAKLNINDIIRNNILNSSSSARAFLPPKKGESPGLSGGGGKNSNTSDYAVLTLHRPSNVDTKEIFEPIIDFLTNEVALDMPMIWPIHPRTQKMLQQFGLWEKVVACQQLVLLHPIGYHEMLRLNMSATLMLTDSGGLQEECCVLGTPCLTLRWNTERPVTLKEHGGASVLVGNNISRIREEYKIALMAGRVPQRPELWDGKTAERCVEAIVQYK
jgi:UDP-N-acetylglucosamine 2-epimerase (non-hydrolysing)